MGPGSETTSRVNFQHFNWQTDRSTKPITRPPTPLQCACGSVPFKGNSVYCKNMASPADHPREKLAVNSRTWLPIVPSEVDVQHCEEENLVKLDWLLVMWLNGKNQSGWMLSCDSKGDIWLVVSINVCDSLIVMWLKRPAWLSVMWLKGEIWLGHVTTNIYYRKSANGACGHCGSWLLYWSLYSYPLVGY